NPVRRGLLQLGFGPNITPLVVILISIVLGWFVLQLAESILGMVLGIHRAVLAAKVIAVVGYLLYGFLDIYALLIVMRIVFSWGNVSYANRLMRFLANATLTRFLAKALGVPARSVEIVNGHASKLKLVRVAGARAADLARLAAGE